MKPIARVSRLLLPLVLAAPMAQAADLMSLSGEGRGAGAIVSDPQKPGREGRCRLTATPLVAGKEMRLKGRCATDQGSAELGMRFVLYDGGVLAGGIASSTHDETVQFDGRLEGNVARLASRKPVRVGEISGTSRFTLTLRDATHFRLVQWLEPETGAARIGMVEMDFVSVQ
ncbi:MAG TPA: hypothetical protein ENK83_01110 [Aliiroseovarius sp.]|nr:hypothetical protein [Aliiroseovarius sp.]